MMVSTRHNILQTIIRLLLANNNIVNYMQFQIGHY